MPNRDCLACGGFGYTGPDNADPCAPCFSTGKADPFERWQVTATNGTRNHSRVTLCLGELAALDFGQRWTRALGKGWRIVAVERVK